MAVTEFRIRNRHIRCMQAALLLSVGYYSAVELNFALAIDAAPVSVLSPANAVLLSGLLLSRPQGWWLVLLAALPAHVAGYWRSGASSGIILGWFAINYAESLLGSVLVRRILGKRPSFDSLRHVLVFLFCCGFIAPLIAVLLVVTVPRLAGHEAGGLWPLLPTRFLADAAAVLALVPAMLTWNPRALPSMGRLPARRRLEGGMLALSGIVSASCMFVAGSKNFAVMAMYLPLPVLLWAALRFGPPVFSIAYLLFAGLAVLSALRGRPLALGSDVALSDALSLQLFLVSVSIPLLLLAVAIREGEKRQALHDVTEQRKAENELREQYEQSIHLTRVALLGKLSVAFAHELKQPLAAILGNAQAARRIMGRQPVDLREVGDIVDDIIAEGKRGGQVIERLRALFVKGEHRTNRLEINELVRDTLALARSGLSEGKVMVDLELRADPGVVQGDWVQLQQVLLNLIVNASESMSSQPSASRRLRLSTDTDREGHVRISVADTGPGIAPDAIDKVFDAFFTTKAHGTGFGLAVSRTIIAAHGGRIEAANNPGGGATFRVILPAHVGVSS